MALPYACKQVFFASNSSDNLDPVSYVAKLKSTMQQLQATPPRHHSKHKACVSKDLAHCSYVFVHHDGVQNPLQPPYDRPCKVIQRDQGGITG